MPRFRSFLPNFSSRAVLIDVFSRGLILVVLCAVVLRYCWIDYQDPFKCNALLHKGDWLDSEEEPGFRRTFKTWQPPGCMLHEYTKDEIRTCLRKKRIVIIGDSTTRQIFWAIARKLDLARAEREMEELLVAKTKSVDNDFVVDGTITLQYVWDPYLNSSTVTTELEAFRKNAHHEFPDNPAVETAGIILLGAPGLWHARKGGINDFQGFKETMDRIVPFMDHMDPSRMASYDGWTEPEMKDSTRNILIMAPVRTPWYPSLSPGREETLSRERIEPFNEHLLQLSLWQGADVAWSFANMTWQQKHSYQESGFHVIRDVANAEADVLLNLRCNAALANKGFYPQDGTCCMNYRKLDWRQKIIILSASLGPSLSWITRRTRFIKLSRFVPSPELLRSFTAFVMILSFCFLTDRTQLFEKGHKIFVVNELIWAYIITSVIGTVTMKEDSLHQDVHGGFQRGTEQDFLSRNQTDEWKGWMQALLLIYHYTGASQTLWGYEISHILGAAYLFLTGYGHTIYFLTTDDYSLNRMIHVLIRLNLFVCTLAYMMRTDYTYYHFAPLVSFWFGVIYYTLRIQKSLNNRPVLLILKVIFFGCLVTAIIQSPSALNSISTILKFTFRIDWDILQLQGLIHQDFLIVYLGMILAIFSHRFSSLIQRPPPTQSIIDKPLNLIHNHLTLFKSSLGVLAVVILPAYWIFTVQPHTKSIDYDTFHPYLSFIPILCYLALRNCTPFLQKSHSIFFIWMGRHSLELYLLQYHIWLAGDSHGILRLGIWWKGVEFAVITVIYLCIADVLKGVVRILVEWIISGRIGVVGRRRGLTGRRMNGSGSEWRSQDLLRPLDGNVLELPGGSFVADGESTPSKSHGFNVLEIWGNMRLRIGVLMVFTWVLNVTYR